MSSFTCQVCLQVNAGIVNADDHHAGVAACHHTFCQPCLASWLHTCESAQPQNEPTCPQCRSGIISKDVLCILGRPFLKKAPTTLPDGAEMDELTEHWLEEQGTKMCPGCGAWVLRSEGCDRMECRCGQRFCYACGGIRCLCYDSDDWDDEEEPYAWDEEERDAWYEENFWYRRYFYDDDSSDDMEHCTECGRPQSYWDLYRGICRPCLDQARQQLYDLMVEEEEIDQLMIDCIKRTYGGKGLMTGLWKVNPRSGRVDATLKYQKSKEAKQQCQANRRSNRMIAIEGMTETYQ